MVVKQKKDKLLKLRGMFTSPCLLFDIPDKVTPHKRQAMVCLPETDPKTIVHE